jgi:hypothetical protein
MAMYSFEKFYSNKQLKLKVSGKKLAEKYVEKPTSRHSSGLALQPTLRITAAVTHAARLTAKPIMFRLVGY